MCQLSSASFKIFSLSFIFTSLTMMRQGCLFLCLLCLQLVELLGFVHWLLKFNNMCSLMLFKIFFSALFPSLLTLNYPYDKAVDIVQLVTKALVFLSLFFPSLWSSFLMNSIQLLSCSLTFYSAVSYLMLCSLLYFPLQILHI